MSWELLKQVYDQAPHLRDGLFEKDQSSCATTDETASRENHDDDDKMKDSKKTKKKKVKNIARGHPVSTDSDDGSNYIASVVDGCKSDCFLSWSSNPIDSRARIILDLEEPHCVRAVKLFWDEEFTPGSSRFEEIRNVASEQEKIGKKVKSNRFNEVGISNPYWY